MHTKQNTSTESQQFLVNGIRCELSVDREGISWRPKNSEPDQSSLRRVEFDQVIGLRRWLPNELYHNIEARDGKLEPAQNDVFQDKVKPKKRNLFDCRRGDKIKVYYSSRNGNNASSQLLKLKRIVIEPIEATTTEKSTIKPNADKQLNDSLKKSDSEVAVEADIVSYEQKQPSPPNETSSTQLKNGNVNQQESGPPSCYASEGSNSYLSSLSSSSSALHSTDRASPSSAVTQNNAACCSEEESLSSLPPNHCLPARPLDNLTRQIEASLEPKRRQRPKRLLVFVNPFGGKGRAAQLYKSQVHRLLDVAGIEAKLVITKYANHARDTIEDPQFNVELFDGIVCVGGDGMFSELMNGLLFRYNRNLILSTELKGNPEGGGEAGLAIISNNNNASEEKVKLAETKTYDGTTITTTPVSPAGDQRLNENGDISSGGGGANDCQKLAHVNNAYNNNDCDNHSENNRLVITTNDDRSNDKNESHDETLEKRQLAELRLALGGIGKPFVTPPIPVGVIGAGSTDANSFGLIGTNDVITATLNIILGNQIKIDVCSVHSINEDRLLRFVSTFVAYGYFGDVIRDSEKFRWLGPSRYDLTGANNLIKNRAYKGLVRILVSSKDGTPFDVRRCHANCELCCLSSNRNLRTSVIRPKPPCDRELSFIEKQGQFIGVNAAITACRCPQTKKGFSPNNHLANGCADLILVRPCSRIQYIQYLVRTGWTKKSAFDLKYVEAYRCRQFEFVAHHQTSRLSSSSISPSSSSSTSSTKSSSSSASIGSGYSSRDSKHSGRSKGSCVLSSSWNVDGEILNEQSVRVKVNNQLLRVFGTGEP